MEFRYQSYIEAFGRHVRKLRLEKNLTQAHLAILADVEKNQIHRLENGHHGATLHTVIAVAVALGKSPRELHEFYHELPLNTNFDFPTSRRGENETTRLVKALVREGDFFDDYKGTGKVVEYYKKKNRNLNSSAVSGALRELVYDKVLERIPGDKKGTFKYRKVRKPPPK